MPVGPRATQSQLERAYRSVRKMGQSKFKNIFEESFETIINYTGGKRAEIAIGFSIGGKEIQSTGDSIINEAGFDGGITRGYSHNGTDFALHLPIQSSLETYDQYRALILYELADSIQREADTVTIQF